MTIDGAVAPLALALGADATGGNAAARGPAGVETHPDAGGVAARLLLAPRAVEIPVEALHARLALFERGTGKLLVATPGAPIQD